MIVTIFLESLAIFFLCKSECSFSLPFSFSSLLSVCVCVRFSYLWALQTLQRSDLVRFRVTLVGYCFAVYLLLMYYHLDFVFFGCYLSRSFVRLFVPYSCSQFCFVCIFCVCLFTTLGVLQLFSHLKPLARYGLNRTTHCNTVPFNRNETKRLRFLYDLFIYPYVLRMLGIFRVVCEFLFVTIFNLKVESHLFTIVNFRIDYFLYNIRKIPNECK